MCGGHIYGPQVGYMVLLGSWDAPNGGFSFGAWACIRVRAAIKSIGLENLVNVLDRNELRIISRYMGH